MAGKAFCIGNGTSRLGFDLNKLKGKGTIMGCNALYREFKPDVLVCVDNGIMHEAYQTGIASEIDFYGRNWTKVPALHYEMMLYAGLNINEVNDVKKEWDGLYENDRGNATQFVMHGSNLSGIVKIIRQDKSRKNQRINKSYSYVSWIYENDRSHNISDLGDGKDHGWACGPMSGHIAIKKYNAKEIYMIGHDLVSETSTVNNIFAGTKNYVPKEQAPTPHVNWVDQWYTLMDWNPDVKFYKVNPDQGKIAEPIKEWQKYEGKNLTYIGYPTLDKRVE